MNEIADIVGGGTPSTHNPSYWDGDINWYAPAEMEGKRYAVTSERKITQAGLSNSSAKILPAGRTILFTSRAGIGKVAILQHDAATNQGFQSLVLKDGISPYFIYSMGSILKKKAEGIASGSTFLEISGKMLGNIDITIPISSEQHIIADFFRNLDDLITLHQCNYFFNATEMVSRNVEKTFSWEQRKLEMLASFSKGAGYSKNDLLSSGTPIILYGRLYTKYETNITIVDTFVAAKSGSIYSRGGEVIVPASGETAEDISIAAVVENKGVILGGDLNIITPGKDLDPTFLALTISFGNAHKELSRFAQGKSVVHLHNADLKIADISYPKCKEQQKIGAFFQTLDRLITLHQRECFFSRIRKKLKITSQKTNAWEQRKLGDIAIFNPKSELPEKFEYVDLESVVGTEIIAHREEQKSTAPSRAQRLAQFGDLFYQTVRPYQKNNCLFESHCKSYVFSTGYAQIRPFFNGYFLLSLVQSDFFVKRVLDRCTGTSYPAINSNDLAEMSIKKPCDKKEIEKIGQFFRSLDRLITLHQRERLFLILEEILC